MTNAQIIFHEQIDLMNRGIIGTTGRELAYTDENGESCTMPEPEPIHTYQTWQQLGFQVRKGEKAITKLTIWKYTTKENEEGEEESKMFMKTAHFFSLSQVEAFKGSADDKRSRA